MAAQVQINGTSFQQAAAISRSLRLRFESDNPGPRADTGIKGLTPGVNVFAEVRQRVSKDYPQTPQYGAAVSAGHTAGGEYLFTAAP